MTASPGCYQSGLFFCAGSVPMLVNEELKAGEHTQRFDAANMASGTICIGPRFTPTKSGGELVQTREACRFEMRETTLLCVHKLFRFEVEGFRGKVLFVRPLHSIECHSDLAEVGAVLQLDKNSFVEIRTNIKYALRPVIERKQKREIVLWDYRCDSVHRTYFKGSILKTCWPSVASRQLAKSSSL